MNVHLQIAELESPAGAITLAVRDARVCALGFTEHWSALQRWLERRFGDVRMTRTADPAKAVSHLREYLDGTLTALEAIDVDPGGTLFQQTVWHTLRRIAPPGCTISYGDLARAVGAPKASRAVGAANGANPISIVIPCHRVIGANGSLTGYGGGMDRKRWLLAHEGVAPTRLPLD
jgi:methylated-DNA-[protein]-cysteine S-methyltransferase